MDCIEVAHRILGVQLWILFIFVLMISSAISELSVLYIAILNKQTYILPGQSNFRCPEASGTFEDPVQCDKYYECYDGVAEERLCQDGLVFDPFSRKREPCDHYFNVDCGDRLELREIFYKF